MVLRASRRCAVERSSNVVLAMIDLTPHDIDHIVMYEQLDGALVSIIGSSDFGPFDTSYDKLRWMLRTLLSHRNRLPS
jgi:hypothetical protein